MVLWTWQGPGFDIHQGAVDAGKSEYAGNPEYLPACREIADHLGTDQFIWASRERRPRVGRVGYQLDVPEDEVLAVIDGFLWNRRLGNRVQPPECEERKWKLEADERHPADGRARRAYCDEKREEYWRTPLPEGWLELAIQRGPESEDPQCLLLFPIPQAWVRQVWR
jgi:hypothetical protein